MTMTAELGGLVPHRLVIVALTVAFCYLIGEAFWWKWKPNGQRLVWFGLPAVLLCGPMLAAATPWRAPDPGPFAQAFGMLLAVVLTVLGVACLAGCCWGGVAIVHGILRPVTGRWKGMAEVLGVMQLVLNVPLAVVSTYILVDLGTRPFVGKIESVALGLLLLAAAPIVHCRMGPGADRICIVLGAAITVLATLTLLPV